MAEITPIREKVTPLGLGDYKNVYYVTLMPNYMGKKIQLIVYNSRMPNTVVTKSLIKNLNMFQILKMNRQGDMKGFKVLKFFHIDYYPLSMEDGLVIFLDIAGQYFSKSDIASKV